MSELCFKGPKGAALVQLPPIDAQRSASILLPQVLRNPFPQIPIASFGSGFPHVYDEVAKLEGVDADVTTKMVKRRQSVSLAELHNTREWLTPNAVFADAQADVPAKPFETGIR